MLRTLFFCSLFFSTSGYPDPIKAQDTSLDTIVVTGTRTDTQLSDISNNLARVNNEDIELVSATHITELMNQVAGVWISRGNGQEHLTAIRSPVLTGAGACGAYFMAEDGIALRAPGFCNANQLFDVNSLQAGAIEIVRGPAGVIYGSNAVHGVINLVSPEWQQLPDFSSVIEGGPNDYQRLSFTSKTQAGRHQLAAYGVGTDDGGYKQQSGYQQQKLNLLHGLESDSWQVTNHLSYSNLDQETAGFVQGFKAYEDPALKQINPNPEAFRKSRSLRLWSQITAEFAEANVILKPYLRDHEMTFLQHFLPWQSTEQNGHRSAGLLSSVSWLNSDYQVTGGFDLDFSEGWLQEFQAQPFSPAIPQGEHYDYEVDALSISPHVDALFRWSETLTLHGGVRFESTRYDYDNQLTDGSACAAEVSNCRFFRPADEVRRFSNVSAKLGLSYQPDEYTQFYAQLSHGYRAPQATELYRLQNGQQRASLTSENMIAFETGLRGQLQAQSQRLLYDISVYSMSKADHIFQDSDRQNVSDGETEHQGIEITLNWQLHRNWQLNTAIDFNHHTYQNSPAITNGVDIKGKQIDTAPKLNANTRLKWSYEQYQAELEWLFMDSYYLDPANSAEYDGHQLLNFRASLPVSEKLSLNLRLNNLLNTDYAERADFAFGNYRYFVGEPRSLFLAVKLTL